MLIKFVDNFNHKQWPVVFQNSFWKKVMDCVYIITNAQTILLDLGQSENSPKWKFAKVKIRQSENQPKIYVEFYFLYLV